MNAIQLENVGKRYWLRHNAPDRRLIEVLHDGLQNVTGLFGGKKNKSAPTSEEFWALKDISLSIKSGEVVALLGRNGAGKSTLLKLISWVMAPTTGRVGVSGRMGCLLEVGSGFHPELTGRENIFLNGAILGMSRREIRQKFDAIVAFAECETFLDTAVKHYSSGMYVRLGFAIAALLDPEILIVDEVLSVGDAAFQKRSLKAIQDAVKRGTTCIMVSHHLPSISSLCQRAVLLQSGRLVADGAPEEVIRQYLTSARRGGGQTNWQDSNAPGNDEVRIRSVKIFQEHVSQPLSEVEIGESIRVEITYDKRSSDGELTSTITLKDDAGTPVFMSTSATPLAFKMIATEEPLELPGQYKAVCTIPENLLNEGRYAISVVVGRGLNQPFATAEECLTFDVHDTGDQRGLYSGAWPGVVRPKLNWTVQRDSE